jgi:hypothetical protein
MISELLSNLYGRDEPIGDPPIIGSADPSQLKSGDSEEWDDPADRWKRGIDPDELGSP